MRVKPKQKVQVLLNSDRSIEVQRIDENVVTFRMFFEVDPAEMIDSKINLCEFKVYEERKNLASKIKTKTLTSVSALQQATPRKIAASSASDRVVVRGLIDLTKKIPNDKIAAIAAGRPARRQKKITFTEEESASAINVVSSETVIKTPNDAIDLKSTYLSFFNAKFSDPAAEINLAQFHSPTVDAVRGFRVVSDMSKLDSKRIAFRSALSKSSPTLKKSILEDVEFSTIEIDFPVRMKKNQVKEYTVEITARASTESGKPGRPLQSIKMKANFRKTYEDHIIPTQAPLLQFTSIGTQRFMKIKQLDKFGTSVAVFRRNTQAPAGQSSQQYKQILNVPLRVGQETQIFDSPEQLGKSIYRVVPYNELSFTSGEFSSAISPGFHVVRSRSEPDETTMLAFETNGGIKISVFNIPNDVVSIRLIRRTLSTFETKFSIPTTVEGGPVRSFSKLRSDLKMFDRPTRSDSIFEYKVMLVSSHGDERESLRSCIIHYSGNSQDQQSYTFTTSSPQVSNSSVTFQVSAPTNQSSLDLVYKLLSDQGLADQYAAEITNNKQLLGKLVALEMLRFDTTTGLNESFGVVPTGTFQDNSSTQKASSVSPLVQGRRYIYHFRLLLRSPSTIFSNSKVSKIDLETGRSFTTDQKKFNSPITQKRGVLAATSKQIQAVTKDGQKFDASSSSDSEMIAGRTALTGQFEVTIPFSDTSLSNLTAESTPRGNIVRWNTSEGLQKIDHIIIYAEYNGKLAPFKAIHFCGGSKMIFLDDKLKASLDEVNYYAQLVFHDFSQGQLIGPAEEVLNAD